MPPHTRAMIAAAAHALVTGRKVAGLYDHAAKRHLRIAAEARGGHLQGYDGDRDARFGGTMPELRDATDGTLVHVTVDGARVHGYDRGSAGHFVSDVSETLVQFYDYGEARWFTYAVNVA